MPTLDLSDEDIALLQMAKQNGGRQGLQLAVNARRLHDALYNHKDVTREYQKQIKAVFPQAQVANDIAEPYLTEVRETRQKLDEFLDNQKKEREEADGKRAQDDFDNAWTQTVKDHNLTEEGQEKLINYMKDKRIVDPEAAALKYFKHNPEPPAPIAPTSIAPANWGIGGLPGEDEKSSKMLMENPEQWADQEAAAALTEIRRGGA
jgi:hypothetical protein